MVGDDHENTSAGGTEGSCADSPMAPAFPSDPDKQAVERDPLPVQRGVEKAHGAWGIATITAAWVGAIASAERPALYSSRDGCGLRRVPRNELLPMAGVQANLEAALTSHPHLLSEAAALMPALTNAAAAGAAAALCTSQLCVLRGPLALMRGWAYFMAGNLRQARQVRPTASAA